MKSLWLRTISALSEFFLRLEANSYIRHFWKSENGQLFITEMSPLDQVSSTIETRTLLMKRWLPDPQTLSGYRITICFLHELQNSEITVQLFDSPMYVSYARYLWDTRAKREMKIKALVALSLSGQLKELESTAIKIVIVDQEVAIDGSHGVARFQVRKVTDFGGVYSHEDAPPPAVYEPVGV